MTRGTRATNVKDRPRRCPPGLISFPYKRLGTTQCFASAILPQDKIATGIATVFLRDEQGNSLPYLSVSVGYDINYICAVRPVIKEGNAFHALFVDYVDPVETEPERRSGGTYDVAEATSHVARVGGEQG